MKCQDISIKWLTQNPGVYLMYLSETLDQILPLVRKPGRYTGGELHASVKDWQEADVRFALVFPDLYEIGMSHYGLQILYHILNAGDHTLAERCYLSLIHI